MLYFNGQLTEATSLYYNSLYFQMIGVVFFGFLIAFVFKRQDQWHNKYMIPGLMNGLVIIGQSLAVTKLSVTVLVAVSLVGQITISLIIDGFGLFGKEKQYLKRNQIIGLSIVIIGVFLLL